MSRLNWCEPVEQPPHMASDALSTQREWKVKSPRSQKDISSVHLLVCDRTWELGRSDPIPIPWCCRVVPLSPRSASVAIPAAPPTFSTTGFTVWPIAESSHASLFDSPNLTTGCRSQFGARARRDEPGRTGRTPSLRGAYACPGRVLFSHGEIMYHITYLCLSPRA